MNFVDILGFAAAALVLLTFGMKTMLPLRLFAIASNVLFASYGFLANIYPVMLLHLALLPLNVMRLVQLRRLIANIRSSQDGEISAERLLPFMTIHSLEPNELLISKGEASDALYYLAEGEVEIVELNKTVGAGSILGEIGIFAKDQRRTATIVTRSKCLVYKLTASQAKQLYFQDPAFGFAVLQIVIKRLLENKQDQRPLRAQPKLPRKIGVAQRLWARAKAHRLRRRQPM